MKTTDLFQSILLFALFLCGLTACNDSDEIRLSPFQETTVKVSTQFRASPFERALFSALNRVLLIN